MSIQRGRLRDTPGFYKRAGGAPANVAVGVSRLGVDSGFIGKVGRDEFGLFLKDALVKNGVDTSHLLFTDQARTPLAFVSLTEDGERDFTFYRSPGADELLSSEEIDPAYIKSGKVLHFSSLSLSSEPARSATLHAITCAEAGRLLLSIDPNLRLSLWKSEREAREVILRVIPRCHLLKLNEQEAEFLSGQDSLKKASQALLDQGPALVVITLGKRGCAYRTTKHFGTVEGYQAEVKDPTGAGDGFQAGLLAYLVRNHLLSLNLTEEEIISALRFANAVAALTTTDFGVIEALPTLSQVMEFLKQVEAH